MNLIGKGTEMASQHRPVIVITGTPGTGKSTHAQMLAEETSLRHINIGDWVKERHLYENFDQEWQSYTVDEDKVTKDKNWTNMSDHQKRISYWTN
jgi:broad-specificity NMP kinase